MKRSAFVIVLAASALLLTGCFPGSGPGTTAAPTESSSASASATPSPTATTAPAAATAGDCTPGPVGDPNSIPIVYTVYGPTQGGPVTIHYTAFNTDGSLPVMTATFSGPVWTLVGYACSEASQGADWTLIATSVTSDAVGCVLDYGGNLVSTKSTYLETSPPAPTTADCTGNPGK
jgi:hypothetical protein